MTRNLIINFHARSLAIATVGDIDHLFSNGAVGWTKDDVVIGPSGLRMFSRNNQTREVIPRLSYDLEGRVQPEENLEAIKRRYPVYDWSKAVKGF